MYLETNKLVIFSVSRLFFWDSFLNSIFNGCWVFHISPWVIFGNLYLVRAPSYPYFNIFFLEEVQIEYIYISPYPRIYLLVLTLTYWFYDMLIHFRKKGIGGRRGRKREIEKGGREKEKDRLVAFPYAPNRGSNPKPGHVLTGNKSHTLWYTGRYSNYLSHTGQGCFFFFF